jgi:hypothetical protein
MYKVTDFQNSKLENGLVKKGNRDIWPCSSEIVSKLVGGRAHTKNKASYPLRKTCPLSIKSQKTGKSDQYYGHKHGYCVYS